MKKGSALLVVLGMLAFMLFSGLSFSVYMRQSRLPTSFLRRTSTTRQLAKAALAEAIDNIDQAIANDPYPGIRATGKTFSEDNVDNFWQNRVFVGVGTTSSTDQNNNDNQPKTYYPDLADMGDTVSTLTLEGLAYVPPNLINEARYYTRRTPTASWHSFWFDSGRYAYSAIDVSDYFDVNRVFSNRPRAATAARRISLAHLFEEGAEHTDAGDGGEGWEDFMSTCRTVDDNDEITYTTYPFVSLADLNIAWGSQDIGGLKNPFYGFAGGGKTPQPYDCGDTEDDADAEKYRCMTFATDSWCPDPEKNYVPGSQNMEKVDLSEEQPFDDGDLNGAIPVLRQGVMQYNKTKLTKAASDHASLRNHICNLGIAQLWDYLDVNRVPLSLAIPTLERVPMVVGIEPSMLPSFAVAKKENESNSGKDKVEETANVKRTSTRTVTYYIDPAGIASTHTRVDALLAYPFLSRGTPEKDFNVKVDGRVEVFFSSEQMGLRPSNPVASLYVSKDDQSKMQGGGIKDKAVIAIPLTMQSVQISANSIAQSAASASKGMSSSYSKEDQANVNKEYLKEVQLTGDDSQLKSASQVKFIEATYTWISEEWDSESESWVTGGPLGSHEEPTKDDMTAATCDFWPLKKNGSLDSKTPAQVLQLLKAGTPLAEAYLNVSVRVRVKYQDKDLGEKTVDLVPACLFDDEPMNGVDNGSSLVNQLGSGYPLLRYNAKLGDGATFNTRLKFTIEDLDAIADKTQTIAIDEDTNKSRIIVSDPRYNHMSENWYSVAADGDFATQWASEVPVHYGDSDYDSDIFMFTSDQGVMQSVYELAFLPRHTTLAKGSYDICGSYLSLRSKSINSYTTLGSSAGDAIDYRSMWRTYRCFGATESKYFDEIGITSGEKGVKANPYSDNKRVLMAAFANTPHDWRAAAEEPEDENVLSDVGSAKTFNEKHAWNGYSGNTFEKGKLAWERLEGVAEAIIDDMRDTSQLNAWVSERDNYKDGKKQPREFWQYVFSDLGWSNNKRQLMGSVDLGDDDTDLYGVDKKFLYGFWHDSFAARQQLFLVFVRAEPMMMGGGVTGQAPPQLGAHAVALVWRDPADTTGTRGADGDDTTGTEDSRPNPHRTRILFYHQFD